MIEKIKKMIKDNLGFILVIVAILLVRTFIVTPVRVSGSSMNKTLKNGDIMLLYKLSDIKKEDIVVVSKKMDGSTIIKRVIALPGDTIECKDGIIYINDKEYKDKYAYGITNDFDRVILKDDEYFLLGDNRIVSRDSRYFGPVKEKYIEGKAEFVIFPITKFGKVK